MKHKTRLFTNGGLQKWEVNYWGTDSTVVNWISVRSLLAISSIYELPSRSIEFVLAFTQADLYVNFCMELTLGMGVDGNKG